MGNMANPFLITVAVVTSVSGAHIFTAEPVRFTSQDASAKFTEVNFTCVLGEDCTLPCHFRGVLREVQWHILKDPVPIAFYPNTSGLHQHHSFREIVFLNVSQSTGDASLLLRGVQMHHQKTYRCTNSSNGRDVADRLVHLSVHSLDKLDHSYLWIWIALPLIIVLVVLVILAWCCYRKVHSGYSPTSTNDVPVADPQGGGTSNQRPQQNGHNNDLDRGNNYNHTGNGQLTGDVLTSV